MPAQDLLDIGACRDNPDGRNENEFYETPPMQTRALLERVPITGSVLEPCAGRGAISRVLATSEHITRVVNNEPYQGLPSGSDWRALDATERRSWALLPPVDWVVTNPPFNKAHQIIPLALDHARVGIAFLLRITWYEATENRQDFLEAHPPDAIISLPRYKYRKDKEHGDSATTAWFVWLKPGAGIVVRNSAVTRAECKRLGAA